MSNPPIQYRRTADDEHLPLNQAQISPSPSPEIETDTSTAPNIQHDSSTLERQQQINDYITRAIDRLDIGPIGGLLKTLVIAISNRLLSSKYINSDPSPQIHLQSFLYGVVTMSLVMFISPFLSVYLDSWVVLLIRLFKHLAGWLVVGFTLHYVIKSKQKPTAVTSDTNQQFTQPAQPMHTYEQLQYSVRPSSPMKPQTSNKSKTKIIKFNNTPSQQQQQQKQQRCIDSTPPPPRAQNRPRPLPQIESPIKDDPHRVQAVRRRDHIDSGNNPRPVSNYDRFINAAYEKERRENQYTKFVSQAPGPVQDQDHYEQRTNVTQI